LSDKNRELSVQELGTVLLNAGLMKNGHHPGRRWKYQAQRLQPDGSFAPAHLGRDLGLLFSPAVSQVSRWDRLKGWKPLVNGFLLWKREFVNGNGQSSRRYRPLAGIRLLMVGPDPAAVQDDPEGLGVLNELRDFCTSLPAHEKDSIILLTLPMVSREQNHLMVNVLQRCSTLVVQNSLQEGFGLTATEAMWKGLPVLGTASCGLRRQIRDHVDGLLTRDPQDPREIAENLDQMLTSRAKRERWGRNARRRVHDQFLVFAQVRQWLHRLVEIAEMPGQAV
jgi:trehalose synthase